MQDEQTVLIRMIPLLFLLFIWIPGVIFVLEKLSLRRRKRNPGKAETSDA